MGITGRENQAAWAEIASTSEGAMQQYNRRMGKVDMRQVLVALGNCWLNCWVVVTSLNGRSRIAKMKWALMSFSPIIPPPEEAKAQVFKHLINRSHSTASRLRHRRCP